MSDLERRCTWIPAMYDNIREKLFIKGFVPPGSSPYETAAKYYKESQLRDPINIYQYGLFKMFNTDDLLYKNERMASANNINLRTPFSDYRLVELSFKIPAKYKIQKPDKNNDNTKMIYKKAIKGYIPDEILYRKKTRGFSQPTSVWYRNELRYRVREIILGSDARIKSYLNTSFVEKIYNEHVSGMEDHGYPLNGILILELWLRNNI
jgi:asparagine synthase (glutamine-hydrolysing)